MNAGALIASGRTLALIVEGGPQTILMDPAGIAVQGRVLSVSPGAISIAVNLGALDLSPRQISVTQMTVIGMQAAALSLTGRTLSVVPGVASIALDAATLDAMGRTLFIGLAGEPIMVSLSPAPLAVEPRDATLDTPTLIAMSSAATNLSPKALVVVPGPTSVEMRQVALAIAARGLTIPGVLEAPPGHRIYVVELEDRVYMVPVENRTHDVTPETRIEMVEV